MEPTLSEIQDYKGDANIAGGSAGPGGSAPAPVSPAPVDGVQYLVQASQGQAAYNKYLADQYQQNLTTGLNDLNSLDISKALPSDLPGLRQKYADLAQQYADNMDVVKNPASNPALWSQLQQQENDLRGQIQQSTAHNVIAANNKDFIKKNPSWATPENQAMITGFENTPMDQRKDFLLNEPHNFDITKIAQAAAPYAMQAINKEELSHNKNWIYTTEGQQFSKQAYHDAANAIKNNTMVNGRTLNDAWKDNFNLLPDDIKKDTNPDDYFNNALDQLAPHTALKVTMKDNPFALQGQTQAAENARLNQEEAFQKGENALNRAAAADKKGELDPDVAAEAKFRNMAAAYHAGQIPPSIAQSLFGDNTLMTKTVQIGNGKPSASDPKGEKITNTVKVPKTEIVRSNLTPDGTFHIVLKDNSTGRLLPTQDITPEQLYNKMDNILGPANAAKVSQGSAKFVKQYFNGNFPTSQQLQEHFGLPYMVPTPVNGSDDNTPPTADAPTPIKPTAPKENTGTIKGTDKSIFN